MKIISSPFNHYLVNTYILYAENKEAILVDPACGNDFEREKLKEIITENQLNIQYILFTHTHIDHIAGVEFAKKTFPEAKLMMHKDAEPLYTHADSYSSIMGFETQTLPAIDGYLDDNQEIQIGSESIKILHCPGHADGSVCLYSTAHNFVLTGDVLFFQSIGRTDLPGGNYETLLNSIKTKLLTLPPDTKVFPGHGDSTSIEYEINNNPFL